MRSFRKVRLPLTRVAASVSATSAAKSNNNSTETVVSAIRLGEWLLFIPTAGAAIGALAGVYTAYRFEQVTLAVTLYAQQVQALAELHSASGIYISHSRKVAYAAWNIYDQLPNRKDNPGFEGLWDSDRKTVDDLNDKYLDLSRATAKVQLTFPPKYLDPIRRLADIYGYFNRWGGVVTYEIGRVQNPTNKHQENEYNSFYSKYHSYLEKNPLQYMYEYESYLVTCLKANMSGYEYVAPNIADACEKISDDKFLPKYLNETIYEPYMEASAGSTGSSPDDH